MGPEEGQCLVNSRRFSGVVGVSSGTSESKMSLGGDDRTKHNIYSSMRRSCDSTLIQLRFRHQQGESSRQHGWPILGSHCLSRVLWYERCVIVGRSDSRHEPDSPFMLRR